MFALEDCYGLTIEDMDGDIILRFDPQKGTNANNIHKMICSWAYIAKKYRSGEVSKEEYDKWRYNYPKYDTDKIWAKVPAQKLTDNF